MTPRVVMVLQRICGPAADKLVPDWGGVGNYKCFVHVDVREERADWDE